MVCATSSRSTVVTGAVEKGDISGTPTPRLLFVFEGLVGHPPTGLGHQALHDLSQRFGRSSLAAAQWEIDSTMVQQMNDLFWRHNLRFDVVTFLGTNFAVALFKKFESLVLPVSQVLAFDSPQHLASNLALMPDVATVYDGDPSRKMMYGSKGRYVSDPHRSLLN